MYRTLFFILTHNISFFFVHFRHVETIVIEHFPVNVVKQLFLFMFVAYEL